MVFRMSLPGILGDVKVAGTIHRHALGSKPGVGGRASIARFIRPAAPRHRRDDARRRRHLSDHEIPGVRDVEVAGSIHRHTDRHQTRGARVGRDCSGHCRDNTRRRRHLADRAAGGPAHVVEGAEGVGDVPAVGDVQVAGSIHRHCIGIVELGPGGRASVARTTNGASPCNCCNHAGRGRHHADHIVPVVRDVDVAGAIHRHACRGVKSGAGGRASVARVTGRTIPRHCRDGAGRHRHHADPVVAGIRDVEVAGAIQRHGHRSRKLRAAGRAAIARIAGRAAIPATGNRRDQILLCPNRPAGQQEP